MEEYKVARATVRIHGVPDNDRIKAASERFMKRAIAARKQNAAAERREKKGA